MNATIEYAMKMKDLMSGPLGKMASSFRNVTSEANTASNAASAFSRIGQAAFNVLNIVGLVRGAVDSIREFTAANQAQQEAETKLAQVMRNTMSATDSEIKSIKELASEQQRLGVIGDEVQLAAAQELGTYLSKTESLKSLMPVMNDMIAQQYGYNATQESAVNIATMMGKVMDGQVGALSRYGYKFNEAQEQILKYGTEAERVQTLAEVITASVGGMNEALAQTPEGRMKQLSNTLGDIKEQIGNEATKLGVALLPSVTALMPAVQTVISKLSDGIRGVTPVIQVVMQNMVSGVNWIVSRIDALKPHITAIAQPFMKMFSAVREKLQNLSQYVEPLKSSLQGVWNSISSLYTRLGDSMSGLLDYLDPVIQVITGTLLPLAEHIYSVTSDIVGDIIEFVSQSTLLKDIFSFVGKIVSYIGVMINNLVSSLQWIWNSIVMPILNGIEKAYRWIAGKDSKNTGNAAQVASVVPSLPTTQERETQRQLATIARNTASNNAATSAESKAVTSGGPKVVNISVSKFFDNIQFNTTNLQESASQIESTVLEVLSRVLVQGTAAM